MHAHREVLATAYDTIAATWDSEIIPVLQEYIRIPNKSPMFDRDWKQNGHMDRAMQLIVQWCKAQPIAGMELKVLEDEGRTPLLLIDIPGQNREHSVLLYGHMDKQPEMKGWREGLGPWEPVIEDGKLYGRGGADDGYAIFASLTAIATLQCLGIPHGRCVVLLEGSEESGSCDLPHYLQQLQPMLGTPELIICLDSDCANYQQLWGTTSLRGVLGGTLHIDVMRSGVHSGYGSGVVPSVFAVLRQVLARIEDANTGEILLPELHVEIPAERIAQAKSAAVSIGDAYYAPMPLLEGVAPMSRDVAELILNRTWRPALSVIGAEGLPPAANAGNVSLPRLSVKLSVRIPPTCAVERAEQALKAALEQSPPWGAKVVYDAAEHGPGWEAPPMSEWLLEASELASQLFYDKPAAYLGNGGSIPFMGMLGEMYPDAQFLITGVLGPKSNAHGPNEFLHIEMVKRLTGSVASVLASHYARI